MHKNTFLKKPLQKILNYIIFVFSHLLLNLVKFGKTKSLAKVCLEEIWGGGLIKIFDPLPPKKSY